MFYLDACFLNLGTSTVLASTRVLRTWLRLSLSEQLARMNYPLALMLAASLGVARTVKLYEINRDFTIKSDDGCSLPISLNPPLPFYGKCYSYCTVSANGILEFLNEPGDCSDGGNILNHVENDSFPIANHAFVAVFYGDVNNGGTIFYSLPVITNGSVLNEVQNRIGHSWTEEDFEPIYLIVATWEEVGYHDDQDDLLNTFQCVVATDGEKTFAIYLYDKVQWIQGQNTRVARNGFNNGAGKKWEIPCSGTESITSLVKSSNIGMEGVWLFRIDQDKIEPACNATCERDELCSCLTSNDELCICKNTTTDEEQLTCSTEKPSESTATVTVTETSKMPTVTNGAVATEGSDTCNNTTAIILGVFLGLTLLIVLITVIIIIMQWRKIHELRNRQQNQAGNGVPAPASPSEDQASPGKDQTSSDEDPSPSEDQTPSSEEADTKL